MTEQRRAELEERNQRRRIEISPIRVTYRAHDDDEDMFSGSSAFAEHILREPIPSKYWPQLDHYKYFSDPEVHVMSFEDITSLYNISNAMKCRLFLTTLKGLARRSFSSLPEGSINSFWDFASQFISHFSSAKPLFKSPDRNRGGSCGEQTRKEPQRTIKLKERIEESSAKATFRAHDFGPSAFAQHILREPIPLKLEWPWLDHYKGFSDPKEHVIAFEDIILFYNISHAVKCRFFLITLKGSARRWFSSLPAGSINSFRDFASQFISQFSYAKRLLKNPRTLLTIKQRENESLKNYMTRFTRASFEVADAELEVVRVALTMGIRDEPFKFFLAKNPQVTMDDLLNKVQKFIKDEEILFC